MTNERTYVIFGMLNELEVNLSISDQLSRSKLLYLGKAKNLTEAEEKIVADIKDTLFECPPNLKTMLRKGRTKVSDTEVDYTLLLGNVEDEATQISYKIILL